jgi:hypothetical protein
MTVIPKTQRIAMLEFVQKHFSESFSSRYSFHVRGNDDILALKSKNVNDHNYVVFFPHHWTKQHFLELQQKAREHHYVPITVFYKDGIHFFKRLGGSAERRKDKSLKHLLKEQRDRIIHLTLLEKIDINLGNLMCYYQPETSHLEESIRVYLGKKVYLDYSHLDNPYARDHVSKDYLEMVEAQHLLSKGEFEPYYYEKKKVILTDKKNL